MTWQLLCNISLNVALALRCADFVFTDEYRGRRRGKWYEQEEKSLAATCFSILCFPKQLKHQQHEVQPDR